MAGDGVGAYEYDPRQRSNYSNYYYNEDSSRYWSGNNGYRSDRRPQGSEQSQPEPHLDYAQVMKDIHAGGNDAAVDQKFVEQLNLTGAPARNALFEEFFKEKLTQLDTNKDGGLSPEEIRTARFNRQKQGLTLFEDRLLEHAALNFSKLDGFDQWDESEKQKLNPVDGKISLKDFEIRQEEERKDAIKAAHAPAQREVDVFRYEYGTGAGAVNRLDTDMNGVIEEDEMRSAFKYVDPDYRYGTSAVMNEMHDQDLLNNEAIGNLWENQGAIKHEQRAIDGSRELDGLTAAAIDAYMMKVQQKAWSDE